MDFCDECGELVIPSADEKVNYKSCCSRCESNREHDKLEAEAPPKKSTEKDTVKEDSDSDIEVDDAIKQQWER